MCLTIAGREGVEKIWLVFQARSAEAVDSMS